MKQIEELTIRRTAEQQMRQLYEPRIQELLKENAELKTKNTYLESKIKEVISNAIKQHKIIQLAKTLKDNTNNIV